MEKDYEVHIWRLQHEAYKLARFAHKLDSDQNSKLISALFSVFLSLDSLIRQAQSVREELVARERVLRERLREIDEALLSARQIKQVCDLLLDSDDPPGFDETADEAKGEVQ